MSGFIYSICDLITKNAHPSRTDWDSHCGNDRISFSRFRCSLLPWWAIRLKTRAFFRWTDAYQKHSVEIARTIFKNWTAKTLASCSYEDGKIIFKEPAPPELNLSVYGNAAKKHLEKGYPEILSLYQTMTENSVNTSEEIRQLLTQFEEKVDGQIKTSCPDLKRTDEWAPTQIPLYYLDYRVFGAISGGVSEILRDRSRGKFDDKEVKPEIRDEEGNKTEVKLTELSFADRGIGRGNPKDIKNLRRVMEQLMSDSEIHSLVKDYEEKITRLGQKLDMDMLNEKLRSLRLTTLAGKSLNYVEEDYPVCEICPDKP